MDSVLIARVVALTFLLAIGASARVYPEEWFTEYKNDGCSSSAAYFGTGHATQLTELCQTCSSSYGDADLCQLCLVHSYAAFELPLSTRATLAQHCLTKTSNTPWSVDVGEELHCIQGTSNYGDDALKAFYLCYSCVHTASNTGECHQCLRDSGSDYSAAEQCLSSLSGKDSDNSDDYNDDDAYRSPDYWYNLFEQMGRGLTHVDLTPIHLPAWGSDVPCTVYFAVGTQNYTCPNANAPFKAAGALARLYNVPQGNLTGLHFFNAQGIPTWEITGKGSVTGKKLADVPSTNPASAPDLLLEVTSSSGSFAGDTFINRVITAGGRAPQRNCSAAGETANVPYTTYYVFHHPPQYRLTLTEVINLALSVALASVVI